MLRRGFHHVVHLADCALQENMMIEGGLREREHVPRPALHALKHGEL